MSVSFSSLFTGVRDAAGPRLRRLDELEHHGRVGPLPHHLVRHEVVVKVGRDQQALDGVYYQL